MLTCRGMHLQEGCSEERKTITNIIALCYFFQIQDSKILMACCFSCLLLVFPFVCLLFCFYLTLNIDRKQIWLYFLLQTSQFMLCYVNHDLYILITNLKIVQDIIYAQKYREMTFCIDQNRRINRIIQNSWGKKF